MLFILLSLNAKCVCLSCLNETNVRIVFWETLSHTRHEFCFHLTCFCKCFFVPKSKLDFSYFVDCIDRIVANIWLPSFHWESFFLSPIDWKSTHSVSLLPLMNVHEETELDSFLFLFCCSLVRSVNANWNMCSWSSKTALAKDWSAFDQREAAKRYNVWKKTRSLKKKNIRRCKCRYEIHLSFDAVAREMCSSLLRSVSWTVGFSVSSSLSR